MMSEKLYPLKFNPILKEKLWGGNKLHDLLNKNGKHLSKIGESWEISGVEGDISIAVNGFLAGNSLQEIVEVYMGDIVGEKVYLKFGDEFPLLIKFIDAQDVLSIQVHPDDVVAGKRHNAYGKTEMWYILQADEGAELISGFNQEIDKQLYITALQSGNLKKYLNFEKVNKGDCFFMPAGRVHAIGSGILLAEIQQTSDITYRIYDWGRVDDNGNPRDLHTELAQDVINFKVPDSYRTDYTPELNTSVPLAECNYFNTSLLEFEKPIEKDYIAIDSFVIFMCIEGNFVIQHNESEQEEIKKGETVLIPAVLKNIILVPNGKCKILEVYIA